MKKLIAFALISMAAFNAAAEKADANKQAVIDYDTLHVDDVTQVSTITGNVIVNKGTLNLKAEKAVIKQTPEGDLHVTLTTVPGKLATFRQKRDGGPDLWVEGEAERIEYDERTGLVQLFNTAKVRQLDGATPTDEIKSEFISYDSLREQFAARNDASGVTKPGAGRGQMIITPRKKTAPATPAAPTGTR